MLRVAARDVRRGLRPSASPRIVSMTDLCDTPVALIEGLPDLVLLVRRDGVVLQCVGGHGVPDLRPSRDVASQRLEAVWSRPVAGLLRQLARRAIASRATTDARFEEGGCAYEARASAHGPECAICVVRAAAAAPEDALDATDERLRPQLDRRGFLRRFKESMSMAALREMPLAVSVIHIDGIADIAQIIAAKVAEQIMSAAILRLPTQDPGGEKAWWYLGQLSESLLAVVLESPDRDAIDACLASICASLRDPAPTLGAEFHLTPYAGVAGPGQGAPAPEPLPGPGPAPPPRNRALGGPPAGL